MHRLRLLLVTLAVLVAASATGLVASAARTSGVAVAHPATHAYDGSINSAPTLAVDGLRSAASASSDSPRPWVIDGSPVVLGASVVGAETEAGPGASKALEPMWAQAPSNGFLGGWSTTETLQPGTVIDRYGAETGRFFSPQGTPLEARSLPTGAGPYSAYQVLKPFDVQGGIVAPAFGQTGLGVQYMASQNVADLIEGGFIKPVEP